MLKQRDKRTKDSPEGDADYSKETSSKKAAIHISKKDLNDESSIATDEIKQ
jgi:hypothetical protein